MNCVLVIIEIWMWLGKELGEDFESPSALRSTKKELVEEGTTIQQVLDNLANRYDSIAREVFDIRAKRVYPHVVVTHNDLVIDPHIVHEQTLKYGDKIRILPMDIGG